MNKILLPIVALFTSNLVAPAFAVHKAILVGVANYEHMEALNGPPNDIRLMLSVLPGLEYADIRVITDAPVDGAVAPTLDNILSAFDSTVASAARGDFIMVYLTGHGTRVPDESTDEDDGFDEVFLPINSQYNDSGGIDNALLDDRIGTFLDQLRSKGANVWLIMDSCFSASGARGPLSVLRAKDVPPPPNARPPVRVSRVESPEVETLGPDAGYFVAFYAAQSYERAWEYNFGSAPDGQAVWQGIFTAKLAERLKSGGGLSYQRLYEAILNDMADTGLMGDGTIQTPFIEGTDLSLTINGQPAGVPQFPIVDGLLSAGLVEGLNTGAVLTVFGNAADDDSAALGAIQVVSAGAVSSSFAPIDLVCGSSGTLDCAILTGPDAAFTTQARFARVVAPSMDTVLRLSTPILLDNEPSPDIEELLSAASAIASTRLGTPIELNSEYPDLWIGFKDDRLWFARGDGFDKDSDPPSNLGWNPAEGNENDLARLLHDAAKAQNLIRISSVLADQAGEIDPDQLEIEVSIRPSDADSLLTREQIEAAGSNYSPHVECTMAQLFEKLPLEPRSLAKQCDRVRVTIRARNLDVPKDVNLIYIDANYAVKVKYRRLQPPESFAVLWDDTPICSDCTAGEQTAPLIFGAETLVLLVTDAVDVQRPLNLEDLEQRGLARARGPGAPNPLLNNLLQLATSGEQSRGALGTVAGQADIQVYRWTVIPREAIGDEFVTLPAD